MVEWFGKCVVQPESAQIVSDYLNTELNNFLNETNSNEFTLTSKSSKLAKLLLILFDASVQSVYKKQLELLVDRLANCNKYIYMNNERVEKCLFIFNVMMSLIRSWI